MLTNIIGINLCQLQTSLTPVNPVHIVLFPFLTKWILLAIWLLCLASLPFLSIHITDLLSNIIRGASSVTIFVSLFRNSWLFIPKYDKDIPAVHAALYSIYEFDQENGPGTCVVVNWTTLIKDNACYYNSVSVWKILPNRTRNPIKWFSVLIPTYINTWDTRASFIST